MPLSTTSTFLTRTLWHIVWRHLAADGQVRVQPASRPQPCYKTRFEDGCFYAEHTTSAHQDLIVTVRTVNPSSGIWERVLNQQGCVRPNLMDSPTWCVWRILLTTNNVIITSWVLGSLLMMVSSHRSRSRFGPWWRWGRFITIYPYDVLRAPSGGIVFLSLWSGLDTKVSSQWLIP